MPFIFEEGKERRKSKINPLILDLRKPSHTLEHFMFCLWVSTAILPTEGSHKASSRYSSEVMKWAVEKLIICQSLKQLNIFQAQDKNIAFYGFDTVFSKRAKHLQAVQIFRTIYTRWTGRIKASLLLNSAQLTFQLLSSEEQLCEWGLANCSHRKYYMYTWVK